MFNKLKQFKDLRDQAKILENALSQESVVVSGAGGKVSLTMNGNLTITNVTIDPELLHPDKKERLEGAIKEAHSDGLKKMQRVIATKMKDMGGLPQIPGLN